MFNLGLVRTPADLYDLRKADLLTLDGWKDKSATRFLASLRESKSVPFARVLFALGIRYVGESTAKEIAAHFGNIDGVMAASREQLLEVNDIGEVIADSIVAFFADEKHRVEIQRLKAAGLQFSNEEKTAASDKLAGMSIVISGNFSISRDEMKALIESNGGKNSSSVSGKTSFLLAGEKPGPEKIKKAGELGVKIVSEAEFMEMIPQPAVPEEDEDTEPNLFAGMI